MREQLTLSETIERYLANGMVAPTPDTTPPPTAKNPPKQKATSMVPQGTGHAAVVPRKKGTAFITSKYHHRPENGPISPGKN
jgi:hypothetical protein